MKSYNSYVQIPENLRPAQGDAIRKSPSSGHPKSTVQDTPACGVWAELIDYSK